MLITLYKGCKLTNKYREVYDNKRIINIDNVYQTAFEHYLNTLTKYQFTVDTVYMRNNGFFIMELVGQNIGDFYEYNYVKFSELNIAFTRYCFINDIVIGNGIVTFYYSEDIWHSYSPTMKINRGSVRNSLACRYRTETTPYKITEFTIKELPLFYQTNEPIKMKRILTEDLDPYNIGTKFYLIALGQRYKLKEATDPLTERELFCTIFYKSYLTGRNYVFTAKEIIETMQQTVDKSYIAQGDFYYEFTNYTVIPSELFDITKFPQNVISNVSYGITGNTIYLAKYTGDNNVFFGKEVIINNNYKNVSIGTMNRQFNIINNGTDFKVEIRIFISNLDFKLLLCFNGKIIDITSDFSIELPYSAITGEQFAQRKIATQLANFTDIINIIKSLSNGIFSGMDTLFNSEDPKKEIPALSNQAVSNTGNVFIMGEEYKSRNTEKYTNTYSTELKGNPLISAFYGIIILEMETDNDIEVENVLSNYGYNVIEIIKDNSIFYPIDNKGNLLKFDVIAFNQVEVYGEFPQSIANDLSQILINGIRINYGI